jgi:hypothetical protein
MAFSNRILTCLGLDYSRIADKNHKNPQQRDIFHFVVEFRGISGEFQATTRRINTGPRGRGGGGW